GRGVDDRVHEDDLDAWPCPQDTVGAFQRRIHYEDLGRFRIDPGVAEVPAGHAAHIYRPAVFFHTEKVVVRHLVGCIRRLHPVSKYALDVGWTARRSLIIAQLDRAAI